MVDVLCVNPLEKAKAFSFGGMIPLGLAWISAVLEENGVEVEICDLEVEKVDFKEVIERIKPKIVCIGGTTHSRFESFRLAKVCKEIDSSILTVYGGVHATFTSEDSLSHIKDIDIIVRGEGELTVLELAKWRLKNQRTLEDILGISYRKNGQILHNPQRPRIQNLDSLPFPARHLCKMNLYDLKLDFLDVSAGSIMTARGCPINCSFCSASSMWGKNYTNCSAVKIVNEIELLLSKYEMKGIKFFDSTLTLNRPHIESICDEILKRGLQFPWECEVRVGTVDKELLLRMKKAGCYYIDLGIESASDKVLKLMHKNINLNKAEELINLAYELGIRTKVFFLFGHIGETMEDALMTSKFIDKHRNKIATLSSRVGVIIYPGTAVEQYARENGYLPKNFSWAEPYLNDKELEFLSAPPDIPVLIQPQLGLSELKKLRRKELKGRFSNLKIIWAKIKKIRNKNELKRFWAIAKEMIKKG